MYDYNNYKTQFDAQLFVNNLKQSTHLYVCVVLGIFFLCTLFEVVWFLGFAFLGSVWFFLLSTEDRVHTPLVILENYTVRRSEKFFVAVCVSFFVVACTGLVYCVFLSLLVSSIVVFVHASLYNGPQVEVFGAGVEDKV